MSRTKNVAGKGKTIVATTIPETLADQIDALAARSGLSRGGWIRQAIAHAAQGGTTYQVFPISSSVIAEDPPQESNPPTK